MTNRTRMRERRRELKSTQYAELIYYYETAFYKSQRDYARQVYGCDVAGLVPVTLRGRYKPHVRSFDNYENVVLHLTELRLGSKLEDYPYNTTHGFEDRLVYTPYKIVHGYKIHGRKVVQYTQFLCKPPFKRARQDDNGPYTKQQLEEIKRKREEAKALQHRQEREALHKADYEYFSLRWQQLSSRQQRKQQIKRSRASVSVPKNLGRPIKRWQSPYPAGSHWSP